MMNMFSGAESPQATEPGWTELSDIRAIPHELQLMIILVPREYQAVRNLWLWIHVFNERLK